jgi:integrase
MHIDRHLTPYFGAMRIERISTFTLEKFRREKADQGLAVATTNRIFATYRHMARRLYEWKLVRDPLPIVKLEAEHNRREYVLSPDEETRLLDAALNDSNTHIWLFIKFALGSALRHSEILSTQFDKFDPDRRRIRVKVKGGHWRDQPLTREVTELLVREREMASDQEGPIFPSTRTGNGHMRNLNRAFRRSAERAKLDPNFVVPHTLRHTAITRVAEAAHGDIATLQKFSGHKSIQMVMRYTHPDDRLIDEALDRMENFGTKQEQKSPSKGHFS